MTNQLLKYIYAKTSKSVIENGEKSNESFERADKIIIWIVGFSIGIFVLLFTKDYDLENPNYKIISVLSRKISIVSLCIVILGLIFRIFSFFSQILLTAINIEFASYADGFATSQEFPSPREIKNTDSVDDLIFYIEQDFKIIQQKPDFSNKSEESIIYYRNLLSNFYKSLAESNDIDFQLNNFKKTVCEYYGFSKEKINKRFENNKKIVVRGNLYQITLWGSYIFFFLTISTFIIGTIIILQNLLSYS